MVVRKPDLIAGILLLSAGCTLGLLAWRTFPAGRGNIPGPAFFPEILCGFLAAGGIFLIVDALRGRGLPEVRFHNLAGLGKVLLLILMYVAAFARIGFCISAVLFMAVMMLAMNIRNYTQLLLVPLTTMLLIWILFRFYLGVPLP